MILALSCPDRPGIVAAVSTLLAEAGGNIVEAHQFDDLDTGRFFMRVAFEFRQGPVRPGVSHWVSSSIAELASRFKTIRLLPMLRPEARGADGLEV
jgi:formyltetrahydrofolate deformylase